MDQHGWRCTAGQKNPAGKRGERLLQEDGLDRLGCIGLEERWLQARVTMREVCERKGDGKEL